MQLGIWSAADESLRACDSPLNPPVVDNVGAELAALRHRLPRAESTNEVVTIAGGRPTPVVGAVLSSESARTLPNARRCDARRIRQKNPAPLVTACYN